MQLTKLGHACVMLEEDRARLVTDPGDASLVSGLLKVVSGSDAPVTRFEPGPTVEL